MTRNSRLAFAAIVLCCTAAASRPPVLKVHFRTCTTPGVERGCVMARSGGRLYDMTAVQPRVGPNEFVQGVGEVTSRPSVCQQGQAIGRFIPDRDQPQVRCPSSPATGFSGSRRSAATG